MRIFELAIFVGLAGVLAAQAHAASDKPWDSSDAILVIDPYESNSVNWDKVATDKKVKAVLHRAYHGTRADKKYEARIEDARKNGLRVGIYLLGKPGDPIEQAELLIEAGKRLKITTLALDIENMNPRDAMTIADAERFLAHVKAKTGVTPIFYTNFSTYQYVSKHYDSKSAFADAPLWVARFRSTLGMTDFHVWKDYTLWQFQSEINCSAGQACYHRVPGTTSDMDVNVFRGDEAAFQSLFSR